MLLTQEQVSDSQLPINHIWDEESSDMLAASVLLFIKNEKPCPPLSTRSFRSTNSSPKRKLFDSEEEERFAKEIRKISLDSSFKRYKLSESEDEDSFDSDGWASSHQNQARLSRSHSQEFDSEFECEQQPHGDEEEDEYNLEEDDDEWSDGRLISSLSMMSTPPTNRIPRKKAPSGTACEKHKRWKKRCPEDCPMRKSKKRLTPRSREEMSPKDDLLNHWSMDVINTEGQLSPRSDYTMDGCSTDSNLGSNDSDPDMKNQLRLRRTSPKVLRRSSSIDEDFMTEDYAKNKSKKLNGSSKRSRGTRKYLPQACDRHKMLHAKCPANCPDRIARDSYKATTESAL